MKFLFINPPLSNFRQSSAHAVPLGLLYLAAVLEREGHEAKVIDADNIHMSWQDMKDRFLKEKPDVVGVTGTSLSMMALIKTVEVARETLPKARIIVGGFGPTLEAEKLLKNNSQIELVALGESEETIIDLVNAWQNNTPLEEVSGIAFLKNGEYIETGKRKPPHNLDDLPFPAYHLLEPDIRNYKGIHVNYEGVGRPVVVMFASRGCPHRCIFCSLGSRVVRFRGAKDVVDEIEKYIKEFGAKSIQLYDDEFLGMNRLQNRWVNEICDEIIKRGLNKIAYVVQARCSQWIELETLKKMKQAGFKWIWWGVESGSQQVLNHIKKDLKKEDVKRAFDLAHQAGLKSLMFIMTGFPEETEEDVKETAEFIASIKPDDIRIHVATPLPGSEMWTILDSAGLIEDYNFLNYTMRGYAVHHTKYFTAKEIVQNYEMLKFRFEEGHKKFVKLIFKSLFTSEGLKALPRRIKKALNYGARWLRWAG